MRTESNMVKVPLPLTSLFAEAPLDFAHKVAAASLAKRVPHLRKVSVATTLGCPCGHCRRRLE